MDLLDRTAKEVALFLTVIFLLPPRQPIGRTGRDCFYYGNQTSDFIPDDGRLNFSHSPVLGLENPIVLQGSTNTYKVEADTTVLLLNVVILQIVCMHV